MMIFQNYAKKVSFFRENGFVRLLSFWKTTTTQANNGFLMVKKKKKRNEAKFVLARVFFKCAAGLFGRRGERTTYIKVHHMAILSSLPEIEKRL